MSEMFASAKNSIYDVIGTNEEQELMNTTQLNKKEIVRQYHVFLAHSNARLAMKFWIWFSLIVELIRLTVGISGALATGGIMWNYIVMYGIVLVFTVLAIPLLLLTRKNLEKHYKLIMLSSELYILLYLLRGVYFTLLDAKCGFLGFSLIVAIFIAGYSLYTHPVASILNLVVTMGLLLVGMFMIETYDIINLRLIMRIGIIAALATATAVIRYTSKYKSYLIERNILTQRDALRQLNVEVQSSKAQIENQNMLLRQLSVTDELTGLFNRRGFINKSGEYIINSIKNNSFITVAAIDIDNFKQINDTIGHMTGDICLVAVAKQLRDICNDNIISYRVGGDEFTIVFDGMSKSEAFLIMDKIQKKVATLEIMGYDEAITLSVGIYSAVATKDDTIDTYLERADKMLYKAKANGKNRIEY